MCHRNSATLMTAEPRRRQEKRPSSRSLLGNGVGPLTRSAPQVGMRSLACDLPCLLGCTAPLAPCVWRNLDRASGSCTSSPGSSTTVCDRVVVLVYPQNCPNVVERDQGSGNCANRRGATDDPGRAAASEASHRVAGRHPAAGRGRSPSAGHSAGSRLAARQDPSAPPGIHLGRPPRCLRIRHQGRAARRTGIPSP